MKMEKRTGKYSDADIKAQEAIVLSLQNYSNDSPPNQNPTKTTEKPASIVVNTDKKVAQIDDKVQKLLDSIKLEMDAIDNKKNRLGNKMTEIPDDVKCPELVKEIKALRKQWIEKNDVYWYVRTHGELPDVKSEPELKVELPNDKFELNKMLLNARSNVSKYRSRLLTSKTDVKKQHYEKNIRLTESLINQIALKMTLI